MLKRLPPALRLGLIWGGTILSALVCTMALWFRGPGLELGGIAPDWPLIWVVCWSVERTLFQGAVAGIALGLIQDGLTHAFPTHALGLAVVGLLTARLQKHRYVREDFISIALITFGMVVVSETLLALQWMLVSASAAEVATDGESFLVGDGPRSLANIWLTHQKITLTSAILSSLWAPALYWPLSQWWQHLDPKSDRKPDRSLPPSFSS